MTIEEKDRLIDAAAEAELAGETEKAKAILKTIPVPADLAMHLKNAVGADILRAIGYNYSEAEAKYGHNWLK
jgi:hypothetical protein